MLVFADSALHLAFDLALGFSWGWPPSGAPSFSQLCCSLSVFGWCRNVDVTVYAAFFSSRVTSLLGFLMMAARRLAACSAESLQLARAEGLHFQIKMSIYSSNIYIYIT